METPLLQMENMEKSFPGVKALDKARLTVKAGTVHALMGENGAGKSTLMKCLFGVYSKDSGSIKLEGKEVAFKSSREALDGGVAMVHQELNQALKRSVADNIWLGRLPTLAGVLVNDREMIKRTEALFASLGIGTDPRAIMGTLPVSVRQMAEIAKAVSYGAKVIVFDEPTSSLTEPEAERLFGIIDKLKSEGCGIIYISHKMEEILRISDEVTVMRDGRWIDTRPAKELSTDELIRLMVGRPLGGRFPEKYRGAGEELLRAEGLTARYKNLQGASLTLRRGEVLGVAGLDGSGRTELLESLFGLNTLESGRLLLGGKEIRNKSPRDAIKNGFALVTEERRAGGIFPGLDIRENTVISSLKRYMAGPFISKKRAVKATKEMIGTLRIKTPGWRTKIRSLSGGNQQKVIFGRWLLTEPTVLLLDEPTRGIDVGAKYEIYALIHSLAEKGKGVVMVSSEMPELLGVCNRIIVMSGGRVAGEVDESATQEEILALAAKYV